MTLINENIRLLAGLWKSVVAHNVRVFVLYASAFLIDGLLIAFVATTVAPLADYFIDKSFTHASPVTEKYIEVLTLLHLGPTLETWLVIFVAANLVKAISTVVLLHYTRRFAYVTVIELSRNSLDAFLSSSLAFFLAYPVGTLQNTMQKESEKLGDGIAAFFMIFAVLGQVLMLSYVAWVLSHTMSLICFSLVVLFLIATRWLDRYVHRYAALTTSTGNVLAQTVIESLVGAKLILAYGRGRAMVRRFSEAYERHAAIAIKSQVLASAIPTVYQAVGTFSVSLALYVSIQRGENLPTLIAALWILLRIVPLISQVVASITNTSNVIPSFIQYHGLISAANTWALKRGTRRFSSLEREIEFEQISFTYPGRELALSNVNLVIPKGSFTAFVGESGSGKTTTADILLRLLAPDIGRVMIDSVPLEEFDVASFLHCVGYVQQESFLFNTSIRDNLVWSAPDASDVQLWEALRLANIEDFVRALPAQLDTVVGDRGAALSGGQRQRMALARALVKRPQILILDEATSALDSESERLIMKSIDDVAPYVTMIVIAHRLSTVSRADQVCVFAGGRIVETGSYASLREKRGSRLYELINSHNVGLRQ
jgi:ABC-type multidrug transport system fused ATPase/permease subunit